MEKDVAVRVFWRGLDRRVRRQVDRKGEVEVHMRRWYGKRVSSDVVKEVTAVECGEGGERREMCFWTGLAD